MKTRLDKRHFFLMNSSDRILPFLMYLVQFVRVLFWSFFFPNKFFVWISVSKKFPKLTSEKMNPWTELKKEFENLFHQVKFIWNLINILFTPNFSWTLWKMDANVDNFFAIWRQSWLNSKNSNVNWMKNYGKRWPWRKKCIVDWIKNMSHPAFWCDDVGTRRDETNFKTKKFLPKHLIFNFNFSNFSVLNKISLNLYIDNYDIY